MTCMISSVTQGRLILLLFSAAAVIYSASAEEPELGGHIKYQLSVFDTNDSEVFGSAEHPTGHELDSRGKLEWRREYMETIIHGELLGIGGDPVNGINNSPFAAIIGDENLLGVQGDDRRLFDLAHNVIDKDDFRLNARIDRVSVGYISDDLVLRGGRQAVTWGNGILFNALDLFNPFSPVEVDKEYKTGDDMLFAQRNFGSQGDIQILTIPRWDAEREDIEAEQSSFAAKYHVRAESLDVDYEFVASRHYGDTIIGAGVSRNVLEAVARFDIAYTFSEEHEAEQILLIANIDRSWFFLHRNFYGFLEYFYSGFGYDDIDLSERRPALYERLARGEIFTLGRNYLAGGLRIELTPLLNFFPSSIFNLDDTSGIIQVRLDYSVFEDVLLQLGTHYAYGGRGSEFGGIELPSGAVFERPTEAYFKFAYYF